LESAVCSTVGTLGRQMVLYLVNVHQTCNLSHMTAAPKLVNRPMIPRRPSVSHIC